MSTRRRFLASTGSTLAATAVSAAPPKSPPLFSLGLMADCQYADVDTAGSRFYRESPRKLKEAVEHFNRHDLAFTFHLGDFIDRNMKSFDDLDPVVAKLNSKLYHALGNHDFDVPDVDKPRVLGKLGLELGYYRIQKDRFRILVIDTTEVSTYRYPRESPQATAARAELKKLQAANAVYAKGWNSRAGDKQVAWIENELKEATASKESVLIFGHHPVIPVESHATWNCPDLERLFRRYPCAKAYLNGHNHAGAYVDANHFHYLTLDGMLETKDQNAFAIAHLYHDRLQIDGSGRQESHTLHFRQ